MPQESSLLILITVVCGIIILMFLAVGLAIFINDFKRELKYLNFEVQRTHGEDRRYWKKQRRRLWLSLIPFIRY